MPLRPARPQASTVHDVRRPTSAWGASSHWPQHAETARDLAARASFMMCHEPCHGDRPPIANFAVGSRIRRGHGATTRPCATARSLLTLLHVKFREASSFRLPIVA